MTRLQEKPKPAELPWMDALRAKTTTESLCPELACRWREECLKQPVGADALCIAAVNALALSAVTR